MTSKYIPQANDLIQELVFITSRSSGPGGQNVNKVNSKVTLKLNVGRSDVLSDEQKASIIEKLGSRITVDGVLIISSQSQRSQLQNKEETLTRLNTLLIRVFTPVKPRKPTKPGKSAKQARLKAKKQKAEKKQWRQKL